MLQLRFGFPKIAKPTTHKAVVVWAAVGGPVGIRFIDLDFRVRDHLQEWVGNDLYLPSQPALTPGGWDQPGFMSGSEFDNALSLIANRVMVVSRASGVAIALRGSQRMTCRVSVGHAPLIPGAPLFPGRGVLASALVRERLFIAAMHRPIFAWKRAARVLNARSILVFPAFASGKLVGVLEVLSRRQKAFDPYDLKRLSRFAVLLVTLSMRAKIERSLQNLFPPPGQHHAGWCCNFDLV